MANLKDFPPGPLDKYRRNASFDWRSMKLFLNGEEMLEFERKFMEKLKSISLLSPTLKCANINEQKRLAAIRMYAFSEMDELNTLQYFQHPMNILNLNQILMNLYPDAMVKLGIGIGMFLNMLTGIGSERHFDYVEKSVQRDQRLSKAVCELQYRLTPHDSTNLDEMRRLTAQKMCAYSELDDVQRYVLDYEDYQKALALRCVAFIVDPSAFIKATIGMVMLTTTLETLGTKKHKEYASLLRQKKIFGCFCLTEIGHGSNTKAMKTRATFDPKTQEFILHSPDFESAKCWAGNLGKHASCAIVYAQLYTPDGVCHGLHSFVVDIRDPRNLVPYPGITVGDMGSKIGLNGVDNGFIMFNNYRIPRINLLNKTGDVTPEGVYVARIKDASKKMGASMGVLSGGRVSIGNICVAYLIKAVTIGVRYAAVRKQFGPNDNEEIPVLEYQLCQARLIPYLCAAYCMHMFNQYFLPAYFTFVKSSYVEADQDTVADMGTEIHVVSSAWKPLSGWVAKDGIQECRETCAGHGYLEVSGLGELRNNNDANITYEGENNVLLQQTSNWIMKVFPAAQRGTQIKTPMGSGDCLSNPHETLRMKCEARSQDEACDLHNIIAAHKWLVCWLAKTTLKARKEQEARGVDSFQSKNDTQMFLAKNLSLAYIQHFIMVKAWERVQIATDPQVKAVLKNVLTLYGLWTLEKFHLGTLYRGGFFHRPEHAEYLHKGITDYCAILKNDAVSLVDGITFDDLVINSPLGKSDGKMYENLQAAIFNNPDTFKRADWWDEVVNWKKSLQAKL